MSDKKAGNAVDRARRYAELQDLRAKLVRQWDDLNMEIDEIDRELKRLER